VFDYSLHRVSTIPLPCTIFSMEKRLYKRKDQNNHSLQEVGTTPIMDELVVSTESGLIRGPSWEHIHHLRFRHPTPRLLTCAKPFLQKLQHILVTQKPSVICPDADSFFCGETISLSMKHKPMRRCTIQDCQETW
jgi:hypothetical protein